MSSELLRKFWNRAPQLLAKVGNHHQVGLRRLCMREQYVALIGAYGKTPKLAMDRQGQAAELGRLARVVAMELEQGGGSGSAPQIEVVNPIRLDAKGKGVDRVKHKRGRSAINRHAQERAEEALVLSSTD